MKNQLLTYFAAIAIVVAGCQKEQLTQNSSNNSSNQSALRDDDRDTSVCTVDFCNGVIVFNDTNEFLDAYACLEHKHETWNDDFDNTYSSLSAAAIEDLIDSTGWDENFMLHYFEQHYSHDSYQSYLDSLEDVWLAGGTWNSATDPDNLDFFDDEITNTFFNSHGMLLIGSSLLVIDYNGDLWVIPNSDCNSIHNASQDPDVLQNTIKATKLFSSSGTYGADCPDYVKTIEYYNYSCDSRDRMMKMKLKYAASHFGGDGTNMKSKIKTYVKKNSHWKHCRRELYTKVEANLTMDCINFINASTDKGPKKRRSLKAKYELAGYYYYYQANHLIGTYKDVSCSVTQTIVR